MANETKDSDGKTGAEARIVDGLSRGVSELHFNSLLQLLDNFRARRAAETIEDVKIFLQLGIDEVVSEMSRRSRAVLAQRAAKKAAS